MKRFIFSCLLLIATTFAISANAQSKMQFSSTGLVGASATNYTDDTTTNTGSSFWYYATTAYTPVTTIGWYGLKLSGTPAGYVVLQKSLDGINYELNTGTSADSFLVTNASSVQVKTFDVGESKHVYYRLKYTGVGTMVVKAHAKILLRK